MDEDEIAARRALGTAMLRGLRCRCPQCGRGRLFGAFLKVQAQCEACGAELHHHRADDAPAYFVIMIVGHLVVPAALWAELRFSPPYWLQLLLWMPLTFLLAIALLQPVKGAIIGLQWANRMHGFGAELPDPVFGKPLSDPLR